MDRMVQKVIKYISDMEKKAKQMSYVKHLKKEVEIGANGTQKYKVKEGPNKGLQYELTEKQIKENKSRVNKTEDISYTVVRNHLY